MECGKLDSHMEVTLASRRRGRGKEVVTKGHAKEGGGWGEPKVIHGPKGEGNDE